MELPTDVVITSHRPVIGRLIVAYKKLVGWLVGPYLRNVFEREHTLVQRQVDALGTGHEARIAHKLTEIDAILDEHQRRLAENFGSMVEATRGQVDEKVVFMKDRLMEYMKDFDRKLVDLNSMVLEKFTWIDEHFRLASTKINEVMEHTDSLFQTVDQKVEALHAEWTVLAERQTLTESVAGPGDAQELAKKFLGEREELEEKVIAMKDRLMEHLRELDERHGEAREKLAAKLNEEQERFMAYIREVHEGLKSLNSDVMKKFTWIDEHFRLAGKKMDEVIAHTDDLFQSVDQKVETLAVQRAALDEFVSETTIRFDTLNEKMETHMLGNKKRDRAISELRAMLEHLGGRLKKLSIEIENVRSGLSRLTEVSTGQGLDEESEKTYRIFEDRFRGESNDIKKRQSVYLPVFSDAGAGGAPVLDIGCGRGEFLELLKEKGVPALGVDLNSEMVRVCREKGLCVECKDAIEYLIGVEDSSLGGVIACQFIEHIPPSKLVRLIKLCHEKLKEGAPIVFETINPESLFAMKWFYMDMTHQRPVHPQTAAFLLETAGFKGINIRYLSPVPDGIRLQADSDENLRKIDNILFGCQDYAVIAKK